MLIMLMIAFIQIGVLSFGGGYSAVGLIQALIVDKYHLITLDTFYDLIALAEMTPGPMLINSASFVGMKVNGIWGLILCSIACVIPALIMSSILAYLYNKYYDLKIIKYLLNFMRVGVVILIGGVTWMMLLSLGSNQINPIISSIIVMISLLLLRKYQLSGVKLLTLLAVVGLLVSMV